jgi:hypothetical protein
MSSWAELVASPGGVTSDSRNASVSQPPPYVPQHSFISDVTIGTFPGQSLDVEFNDVKATADPN